MSNPLRDMEKPDAIFCIGTNMTEAHPVAAMRIKKALRRGAKLIVADPRKIPLAKKADVFLQLRVGTDVALLGAMAHVIVREGLVDENFIAKRTENFAALGEHLKEFTPEWAETITGVPAKDIEQAAIWYGEAANGAIFYTLGITEHICGVDNVQSLCNLVLLTGHIGREGTGINPMRGQNNVQGAGDCGALPNNYPGFQPVTDPANQAKFREAWGVEVDIEEGWTKVRALDECGKKIHAFLICGENTVVSDADRAHCEHALRSLDHMVVIDIFRTETADLADVILPATAWAETDGVFTNTERRPQRVRAAVPPPGVAKPDWWIIAQIAKRLGAPGFDYESPKEVFNELCELSPTYHGLDWDLVAEGRHHWPVPEKGHAGTPVLHIGEFPRGRGLFMTPSYRDPAETIDDDYPVWLTTGRRLAHYHTRTMTGRSVGTEYLVPEELVEVHPDDVADWGLEDGEFAVMSSRRGEVMVKVEATDKSPRGTVFCSFSFSEVPINALTGSGYDPITDTAELKVCPVRIERATTSV
ncbi:MAG: molybdopterin-dependent oxidoreductase [bacterium]|nr:molybdopterin-dependent oxidoreductase [bacterium]